MWRAWWRRLGSRKSLENCSLRSEMANYGQRFLPNAATQSGSLASDVRETTSATHIMNNKTTAENLERKFDQGEDVMDYFDLAKASRPLLEKERINLDIPHWMILKIDRIARRKGMPRQAQIKEWLAQKLKEEPSAI